MMNDSENIAEVINGSGIGLTPNLTLNEFYHTYSQLTPYNDSPHSQHSSLIPKEIRFTEDSLVSVIAYSILFCFSGFANLLVFITLFKNRHRKSRVNLFIMHLCIADMIVTFIMMPMEIGWHITVAWKAGDIGCRILMFCRAFGFYLSSFILITISLDRYFAITNPLSLSDAGKRARMMIASAWLFSFGASIPQSVIFHVKPHPQYTWFVQCVTFDFFPSWGYELAYNLFNICALYVVPLIVIIVSYTLILLEMTKKTKSSDLAECHELKKRCASAARSKIDMKSKENHSIKGRITLRRSRVGLTRIERARIRTLKMTVVIVLVFITCWTPYFVISAWWWIDKSSAEKIDNKIQRALFLFAVSNSCVNPVIYGMFTNTFLREIKKILICKLRYPLKRKGSSQPFHIFNTSSKYKNNKGIVELLKYQEVNVVNNKATNSCSSTKQGNSHTDQHSSKHEHQCNNIETNELERRLSDSFDESDSEIQVDRNYSVAEQLTVAACVVALPTSKNRIVNQISKGIKRVNTPPHISVGKGTKEGFEKYLLI